ncbi:MAG: helix-turn-helix domain-containing protein [Chitinophagaceae bacterium]
MAIKLQIHIGGKVRAARKAANLTLEELGKKIGVTNQALSAIERGEKNPSKQTLMNLARVLKTDFGERWLTDYLSTHQAEFQLVPLNKNSLDKENLMHLFKEFLDYQYGAGQVDVVEDYQEKSVSVPVMYELNQHGLTEIENTSETILVPPHMVPPGKGAIGALIRDWFINEAFIGPGDIVVILEREDTPIGKTILAYVNEKLVIRRCSKKGRNVVLSSLVEGYEPIETSLKQFVFMAEITGLIRSYERA